MDVPALVDAVDFLHVEWLTEHIEHVTEHGVADRHGDASPSVADCGAAEQTVGWLHAHAAHPAFADLLGDLSGDGQRLAVELDIHLHGAVDLRQCVGWELGVDHRSGDSDDPTLLEGGGVVCSHGHCLMLPSLGGALRRRPRFP